MNSLTFYAPSGSKAGSNYPSLFAIESLATPGNTSGANFIGFFGLGGPEGSPAAVIIDRYQDRTFITNSTGTNLGVAPYGVPASGELINHKYVSSSSATVSGVSASLINVPQSSGTLLMRFDSTEVSPVKAQNPSLYTVVLNSGSGIDNQSAIVTNVKIQCYEPGADSTWTQTAGVGAIDNKLVLTDHDTADDVHDFFVGISASPEAVGERSDFGLLMVVEFL